MAGKRAVRRIHGSVDMKGNASLERFRRSSAAGLILVAVIIAGSLGLARAGHAVLASSEINGWFSYGLQAAHPVEVRIVGLSREEAYRANVLRVSPRGNTEPLTHRFAGDGISWDAANNYFGTVRVELPEEIASSINETVVRIGPRAIETASPMFSPQWRRVDGAQGDKYAAFQFVPEDQDRPFTVVPVFDDVLNYVGDVTLAFWALLWAALVVIPPAAVLLLARRNVEAAARLGRSLVVTGLLAVLIVTVAQFLAPPSSRNAAVFPLRDVATGLSLGMLLSVLILTRMRPIAVWESDAAGPEWLRWWMLPATVLLAIALRMSDLDSLMQVDTYNISAALALVDTGEFAYDRNLDITHSVAALVETFGRSLASARIPFLLAGAATTAIVYATGAHVSRRVGFIAAVLFAISPHHIAVANYIREYPVNLLVGQFIVLLQFCLYARFRHRRWLFYPVFLLAIGAAFAAVYAYSEAASNRTIPSVLQMNAFVAAPLLLHHIRANHRRAFAPAILLATLVAVAGIGTVHRLGPFSSGLIVDTGFLHVYFDPFIVRPMQWFSLSAISGVALAGFLVLPYVGRHRDPYMDAALLAFWGTLALFTLKFTQGSTPRYIYHIAGLYPILFAGALIWLAHAARTLFTDRRSYTAVVMLSALLLVNPANTVQGALNLTPNGRDDRRPASLASGNYYYHVAKVMEEHGADRETPILQEYAGRPFHPSWVFQRPFTRYWTAWNRIPHETGENVYFLARRGLSEDQSREAFTAHESGLFLTSEYHHYPPRDFRAGDVSFEHLRSFPHPWYEDEGFALYRWTVNGAFLPPLSLTSDDQVFRAVH